MNNQEEIKVIIKSNGDFEIKVSGIKGISCKDITSELESILGGDAQSTLLTDEYFENEDEQNSKIRQNNG